MKRSGVRVAQLTKILFDVFNEFDLQKIARASHSGWYLLLFTASLTVARRCQQNLLKALHGTAL